MKLKLITEVETIGGIDYQFTTKSVLEVLLPSNDSAFGYTLGEIRLRGKLLDELEANEDEIEVSKEMAEMLLTRLEGKKLSIPFKNLITLSEELEKCKA